MKTTTAHSKARAACAIFAWLNTGDVNRWYWARWYERMRWNERSTYTR